jgi:hypothetical protein
MTANSLALRRHRNGELIILKSALVWTDATPGTEVTAPLGHYTQMKKHECRMKKE